MLTCSTYQRSGLNQPHEACTWPGVWRLVALGGCLYALRLGRRRGRTGGPWATRGHLRLKGKCLACLCETVLSNQGLLGPSWVSCGLMVRLFGLLVFHGCSGLLFIMVLDYAALSQSEQAQVVLPRHVFLLISLGRTPDTAFLVLAAKLYGKDKKQVHRIPYSASIVTGACTFYAIFLGMLPATSLPTLAISAPDMKVGDWRSWADWPVANWSKWSPDARVLW